LTVALGLVLTTLTGLAAGDLAVYGVRPGMTADQVQRLLGRPQVQRANPPSWIYRREHQGVRGQDDPTVFFDSARRVRFVMGSRLDRDDQPALRRGARAAELEALLGRPSAIRPGQAGTSLYVYESRQLTVVVAGNPAQVLVFGLGQEPTH
jgi:outer membrane protein assembly factor BamE (lipoprotein component of BamABCDE complex)